MDLDDLGKRICILGPSNSGKSTLAAAIGRARSLRVTHLDQYRHLPEETSGSLRSRYRGGVWWSEKEAVIGRGRDVVREQFRWIDGAADTWTMLRSGDSLAAVVDALAALIGGEQPDVVLGVESRGFVLAPAVALRLGVGFVPVRKDVRSSPGPLVEQRTGKDYRGNQRTLLTRRDLVSDGQRAVLVDDWIETGSQAVAAQQLVAQCGAELVAVAVVVDEASCAARAALPPIRALVRASEL